MKQVSQIVLLLLFCTISVQAEIYRWVDKDGVVIYSDKPQQGAEHIKMPTLETYDSSNVRSGNTSSSSSDKTDKGKQYTNFKILSPVADSTVRNNAGKVALIMQLEPKLNAGHKIFIIFDGQRLNVPGLRHSFTALDRGAHTISAEIVDASGSQLAVADEIIFYVQRFSKLSPAAKARKK